MIVQIGTSTLISLQGMISSTFSSLLPLIAIVIAVPMTFYVIRKIVALFPKK